MRRAHLVELDIAWLDPAENFARVGRLVTAIEGGGVAPGDLVVLPEMFDTGFCFETERTRDRGATLAFIRGLARSTGAHVVGGRSVEASDAGRALNVLTWACPDGRIAGEYAKIHPFSIGGEDSRFDAGREIVLVDWDGLRVCPTICYDLRFPELYRRAMRAGAEAFVVAANWPAAREHHWRTLLAARAIEDQAWVLGVNRRGRDPTLNYPGASMIVSPKGEVAAASNAGAGTPDGQVITAAIDPEEVRAWRRKFPASRDIRLLDEAMTRLDPR